MENLILEQFSSGEKRQILEQWCWEFFYFLKSYCIKFTTYLEVTAETAGFFPVHGVFKLAKLLPSLKEKIMIIILVSKFLVHVQEFFHRVSSVVPLLGRFFQPFASCRKL